MSSKLIVSSAHLAEGALPELSELEFSLTLAANAYQRWLVRCAAAAGQQLTPLEVLILHTVRHRDRPKRFSDITLVLHIDDVHLANYAVKKLAKLGLVEIRRVGKERLIAVTSEGVSFCDAYRENRERLLVELVQAAEPDAALLSETAARLRALSGNYTEAARAAATL